jgi:hypothetical protein
MTEHTLAAAFAARKSEIRGQLYGKTLQQSRDVLRRHVGQIFADVRSAAPPDGYRVALFDDVSELLTTAAVRSIAWVRVPEGRLIKHRLLVESLLDDVERAMEFGDRILAVSPPVPPPVRLTVADDKHLLDACHDLLAAHAQQDGEMALLYVDSLRRILSRSHDIKAISYDESTDSYFDRSPAGDRSAAPRTMRPALVRESGHVLRRGEMAGPRATAAEQHPDLDGQVATND